MYCSHKPFILYQITIHKNKNNETNIYRSKQKVAPKLAQIISVKVAILFKTEKKLFFSSNFHNFSQFLVSKYLKNLKDVSTRCNRKLLQKELSNKQILHKNIQIILKNK